MTAESPRWKAQHPIDEVVNLGPDSRQSQKLWIGDSQKILNRATIGVGRAILQALSKTIQGGEFAVHGRPSDAPFDEPKTVPQTAFSDLFELNLFDNTITLGAGDAKISSVSLYPVDSSADQPRSNSFEKYDLVLVEEMRQMIDSGKASSILGAAVRRQGFWA